MKAREFISACRDEWQITARRQGRTVSVTAIREVSANESETLECEWNDGRAGRPAYMRGEAEPRFLPSVAEARRLAAREPDLIVTRKGSGERAGRRYKKHVPFDLENDTEEDICNSVRGRKIIWRSSLSDVLGIEMIEEATVFPDAKNLYISYSDKTGREWITFASYEEGWRSVDLRNIIAVESSSFANMTQLNHNTRKTRTP